MVVSTHKDVRVKVDDKEICCNQVEITTSISISPVFTNSSSVSTDIKSTKSVYGAVGLEYYHTGEDPLVHFITNRVTPVLLDVGGLYVSSGYLSKYELAIDQFSTVRTKANFKFFEEVKGSFDPTKSAVLPSETELIKSFNAEIEGGKSFSKDNLINVSYAYSCDMQPVYHEGSIDLKEMRYGARKIDGNISVYNDDIRLPSTGLKENFKINLKDKNENITSSFVIDGLVRTKKIGYAIGGIARAQYGMAAAKLGALEGDEVSISSFAPINGAPSTVATHVSHSNVTVVGNNFVNVDQVLIGEFPCQITDVFVPADPADAYTISFDISSDILSGYSAPITIITEGARASSSTSFFVTGGLVDMHGFNA